jgi:hypothetical protein
VLYSSVARTGRQRWFFYLLKDSHRFMLKA